MENWRAVTGFEGRYEVSDLGRVRSLDRIIERVDGRKGANGNIVKCRLKGRLLRPGLDGNGYPSVVLPDRTWTVAVLVLRSFIGPAPEGEECCHRDGKRANSDLTNLKWGTRASNVEDMIAHGTKARGSQYASAKLTEDSAREVRRLKGVHSQSELARMFNVSPAAIQAIHDGRTWKHA